MSKDKIHGGLSDNMTPEKIAKKHGVSLKEIKRQISKGKKVEIEHVNDEELAEEIALDHLFEIPDYYTRLEKMENSAKKDMIEGKENITEFAKRMRELAGFSEGKQNKSIKTIQEGETSPKDSNILKEGNEEYGLATCAFPTNSKDSNKDDFEVIDFEQGEIEEGENDSELYNLSENTVIVLDFLNEDKSVRSSYEGGYDSYSFEQFLKEIGAKEIKTVQGYEKGFKSLWSLPKYDLTLETISFRDAFSDFNVADFFFERKKKKAFGFKKQLSSEEIEYAESILKELNRQINLNDKYIQSDYYGED